MKNRPKHTNAYLYIAITILIAGIIVGMILGSMSAEEDVTAGFKIMFYIWILTALFDIFVLGIYSICHRLDLLIDKKN